jgi:curved DNA-binding protein CbpA
MYAQDYYLILEIPNQATTAEVKESFRRLARQHHPDLNPGNAVAEARFKTICQAYNVLSDPEQRQRYDQRYFAGKEPPNTNSNGAKASQTHQTNGQPLPEYQQCYRRGLDAVAKRDYGLALGCFCQAIKLNPDYWEAYLERAQIYYIQSKDRNALEDCGQVIQRHPQSSQAYYLQGRARHRLGYLANAVESYSQAIAHNSAHPQAYYYRGAANLELQSVNAAINDFEAAQELYHTQRDLNGYNLASAALAKLKRKRADIVDTLLVAGRDTLATIRTYLLNPNRQLLLAYGRLNPKRILSVGLGMSLVAQICFVLATGLLYGSTQFGTPQGQEAGQLDFQLGNVMPGVLILSFIPSLCLLLMTAWMGALLKLQRSWEANLFVAAATVLPLNLGYLLGSGLGWGNLVLLMATMVFAGSYAILTLYSGYTQIHRCPEAQAAWMVPMFILLTVVITYRLGQLFLV